MRASNPRHVEKHKKLIAPQNVPLAQNSIFEHYLKTFKSLLKQTENIHNRGFVRNSKQINFRTIPQYKEHKARGSTRVKNHRSRNAKYISWKEV